MQLSDYPNLHPGVCFLCEQANPCRYVDTFRTFEPGVATKLTGRKYVCEGCITEAADLLGILRKPVGRPKKA